MEEAEEKFERTKEEVAVGIALAETLLRILPRVTRPANTQDEAIIQYHRTMRGLQGPRHFHNAAFTAACLGLLEEVKSDIKDIVFSRAAVLFCRAGFVFGAPVQSRKACMMAAFEFYDHPERSLRITKRINATYDRFPFRVFCDDRDYVADIVHHPFGASEEDFRMTWSLMLQEFQGLFKSEEANKAARIFKARSRILLRRLLAQSFEGGIFRTDYFRTKFERRARRNIVRMLQELRPKRR